LVGVVCSLGLLASPTKCYKELIWYSRYVSAYNEPGCNKNVVGVFIAANGLNENGSLNSTVGEATTQMPCANIHKGEKGIAQPH